MNARLTASRWRVNELTVSQDKITVEGLTGDAAIARALKQSDVDVLAAYPITPQTIIVEDFQKFAADGEVHTRVIPVESEHSAMSACVGASAVGARVATASASAGLALMWEILYCAASMRMPIVFTVSLTDIEPPELPWLSKGYHFFGTVWKHFFLEMFLEDESPAGLIETLGFILQSGRIDVGFLGAAQIDEYGNLNTTYIGPFEKPLVKLPRD
jgi:hypothetical protein